MNINKELFAKRFKKCREDNNLTQEEMASMLGVKRGTVAAWEAGGYRIPELAKAFQAAEIFKVSVDYLLGRANDPHLGDVEQYKQEKTEIDILIKKRREKLGFSQCQLSLMSGVSNTEINRIETGERKQPSQEILGKLASPLRFKKEELFEAAGYFIGGKIPSEIQVGEITPIPIYGDIQAGDPMLVCEEVTGTLGTKIAKLRQAKEITQEELAKLIPVDQSMISYYEKNKKKPSTEVLEKIADIFGVSVDYLLGRAEDPRPVDDIKKANAIDFSIIKGEATIWKTEKKPSDIELENFLLRTNIHFDGAPLSDDDKEDLLTYLKVKWERERKKREQGGE